MADAHCRLVDRRCLHRARATAQRRAPQHPHSPGDRKGLCRRNHCQRHRHHSLSHLHCGGHLSPFVEVTFFYFKKNTIYVQASRFFAVFEHKGQQGSGLAEGERPRLLRECARASWSH